RIDAMAYWHDRAIVIPAIAVDGADVQVLAVADGGNNYTFPFGGSGNQGAAGSAPGPRIGLLAISNSRIHAVHVPLRADFDIAFETREADDGEPRLVARAEG